VSTSETQERDPVAEDVFGTELVTVEQERGVAQAPAGSLPSEREWQATMAVAAKIAATPFVPESYRAQPEAVVAAILTGRELGIGPMQSLRDIHMIDGRPSFSASLSLSQMRRGGLVILESESTTERAWIRAQRSDTGEIAEVEWTFEEAAEIRRKGKALTDGDNWKNYPADMLWARAVGRLARRLGSDLLGGMVYTTEELRDLEGFEGGYDAGTASGIEPPTWEEMDPGAVMHPKAPRDWKEIQLTLNALDPQRDWPVVVRGILQAKYRVERVADLGSNYQDAGRRMANFAGYLAEVEMEGKEFPPPSADEINAAMGWAFDGLIMDIPEPKPLEGEEVEEGSDAALSPEEAAEMAAAEDAYAIPFGEEGKEQA
jgi:hypothetical protein